MLELFINGLGSSSGDKAWEWAYALAFCFVIRLMNALGSSHQGNLA